MDRTHDLPLLLIFDLDGTLYDTTSSFLPTMERIYSEFSVTPPPDREIMAMVGETFEAFVRWLKPQGFPITLDALARRISEHELASIPLNGKLYPGVGETLGVLRGRGALIALCTNGDRRYADLILGTFGLSHLFDSLKTHDRGARTKTDRVGELISEYRPERCFMVGDRYHDVEAGRANGCTVIGATYGFSRQGELDDADRLIGRFDELLAAVDDRAVKAVQTLPLSRFNETPPGAP